MEEKCGTNKVKEFMMKKNVPEAL